MHPQDLDDQHPGLVSRTGLRWSPYTLAMMRRGSRIFLAFLGTAVVAMLIACGSGSRAEQLSDAQKTERVRTLYQEYRKSFPTIQSVTVEELRQLQSGSRQVVLVDVRQPEEMEVSMIPGAIAARTFEGDAESYRGAIVVPYCTVGYRSGLYTRELADAGWDARNLEGSILAWTLAGFPLEDADGATHRVHVYGRTWNLAGEDFVTIW